MQKHIAFAYILPFMCAIIAACNPMSVPTPDALCQGIHNRNVAGICHGSKNGSPSGYCTEPHCHGSGLRGGNTGAPSCYACHGPYWQVRALHSKSIFGTRHHRDICTAADFTVTCGDAWCHTPALTGSTGYMKSPGCDKCHGIPVADGANCEISAAHTRSMDGRRHHEDVCTTLATCATADCHGLTLQGGTTGTFPGPGCTRCHEETPAEPECDD